MTGDGQPPPPYEKSTNKLKPDPEKGNDKLPDGKGKTKGPTVVIVHEPTGDAEPVVREQLHLSDEERQRIRTQNKVSIGFGICSTIFCLNVILGPLTVITACQSNWHLNRGNMAKANHKYRVASWLLFAWLLILGLAMVILIIALLAKP